MRAVGRSANHPEFGGPVLVDVEQRALVFGDDCSATFSDAALGAPLTQSPVDTPNVYPVDPEGLFVDQVGDIQFSWPPSAPSPDICPSPELYVVAVPASAV